MASSTGSGGTEKEPLLNGSPAAQPAAGAAEPSSSYRAPTQREQTERFMRQIKDDVRNLSQGSIDESAIHKVAQYNLLAEFLFHLFAITIFFVLMFGSLRLQGGNLLLRWIVGRTSPLLGLAAAGLSGILEIILATLVVEALINLFCKTFLDYVPGGASLWEIMRGQRHITVTSQQDLYALACSLVQIRGMFLVHLLTMEQFPDDPIKILQIGANQQEVRPGAWIVQEIRTNSGEGVELISKCKTSGKNLKELFESYADDDKESSLRTLKVPCNVVLKMAGYKARLGFLKSHIIARLIVTLVFALMALSPLCLWSRTLLEDFGRLCDPSREGPEYLRGLCEGDECQDTCGSIVQFANAAMLHLKISPGEFGLTVPMLAVFIFFKAAWGCQFRWRELNDHYLLYMTSHIPEQTKSLHGVRELLKMYLGLPGLIFMLLRAMRAAWATRIVSACGRFDDISESAVALRELNPCFRSIVNPSAEQINFQRVIKELPREDQSSFLLTLPEDAFKVVCLVPISSVQAAVVLRDGFFKATGDYGYKDQLDLLCATADLADAPSGVANLQVCTRKRVKFANADIPPNPMVVTHIIGFSEEGETMRQFAIGKTSKADQVCSLQSPEDVCKLLTPDAGYGGGFFRHFQQLSGGHWPLVWLPSADNKTPKCPPEAISILFLVLQVSQPFYEAMPDQEGCLREAYDTWLRNEFTRQAPSLPVENLPEATRPAYNKLKKSYDDKPMGDETVMLIIQRQRDGQILQKVSGFIQPIMQWTLVIALAFSFSIFVPLVRVWQGGELFPSPFKLLMFFNFLVQFLLFLEFLYYFEYEITRFHQIRRLLTDLENSTSQPRGGISFEEKEDGKLTDPFDLSIAKVDGYRKNDPQWNMLFKEVTQNVSDWHKSVRYLRWIMAPSRLWVQATVGAAVFLLACFLLVSLVQALSGRGAVDVDTNALAAQVSRDTTAALNSAIERGSQLASDASAHISQGLQAATAHAASTVSRRLLAAAGNGGDGRSGDLHQAAEVLRKDLQPFRVGLHDAIREQAAVLSAHHRRLSAEDYLDTVSVSDVTKATKAQVQTLVFIGILLIYSVRLVANVSSVNAFFDRHASLLTWHKEQHRMSQQERETRAAERASEDAAASTGEAGTQKAAIDGAGGEQQAGEATVNEADAEDSSMTDYEQMLDQAITSARDHAERYSMKVFGTAIRWSLVFQMLGSGLIILFQQGTPVINAGVENACMMLENSSAIDFLQTRADAMTDFINGDYRDLSGSAAERRLLLRTPQAGRSGRVLKERQFVGETKTGEVMGRINVTSVIHEVICSKFLKQVTSSVLDDIEGGLNDLASPNDESSDGEDGGEGDGDGDGGRRLDASGLPPSSPREVVDRWWRASAGDPLGKLAVARLVLEEHQRAAHRLLVATPTAVSHAFAAGGVPAALDVGRLVKRAAPAPSPRDGGGSGGGGRRGAEGGGEL